ncbi:MAG: LOG family protein YvdD [Bacteroidetes bacterium ADurb.BinA174]|nr:MAG: LOG family protein YvdD [Bacteroidetes bacterium ADurb.BinA174]
MQDKENSSGLSVVVYCASSAHIQDVYIDAARKLGKVLAENNITCITGAGKQGLMGVLNDSVLENNGKVKGIIPQFMIDSGWCHPQLTELVITESMHERKFLMAKQSDAAIALPGGFGTLEELAEILTWKQLGLYKNPIIILNVNGYYDLLLAMFDKMIGEKFLHHNYRKMWQVVDSPDEVIDCLQNFEAWEPSFTKYDKKEL